ncbi:MAG TPA: thioester reductase domain-containing protein, partial [Actinomycetota bacterium]|nr:thioester reductase domain-containing protein [Actinomycetota bacterium]
LYRTGDRARHLPDGSIAFLGRVDNQIKIRGFRIEPGEIESAIARYPGVDRALVVAFGDEAREKRLAAYVVPDPGVEVEPGPLRGFLENQLPGYMVPSVFLPLERFPLNASGKVDRSALPDPAGRPTDVVVEYVAPSTELEIAIARIWSEVLEVERVGVLDNFFALGGHSLQAARLVARVRRELKVDLPLRALFEYPTVGGLAHASELALATRTPPEEEVDLWAEAVLAPDIDPAGALRRPDGPPRRILLTGATGFLGAFLLHELLEQSDAEILCLVRAADEARAAERLRTALETVGLWRDEDEPRIVPVVGNLARPRLGLVDDSYGELAGTVDLILHNGAWVNAMYPYSMLKATNVGGTEQILRLAATGVVKPVHHISSLSVFPPILWVPGGIAEEFQTTETEGFPGGYPQSKWVAEQLVNQAAERGIPAAIYRPNRVSGDSATGVTSQMWGVEALNWLLELGVVPAVDRSTVVDFVPVDFVTKAIVHLALNPQLSLGKAFHLSNPHPGTQDDLMAALRRAGYEVPEVEVRQWAVQLYDHIKDNPNHPLHELLPFIPAEVHELLSRWRSMDEEPDAPADGAEPRRRPETLVSMENTLSGVAGIGLRCPPVSELLDTYVGYYIRSGGVPPGRVGAA